VNKKTGKSTGIQLRAAGPSYLNEGAPVIWVSRSKLCL